MMHKSATKKIPVGHAKEYTVWSMDNITNDDLASLTHALGGQSYDWGFQLKDDKGLFTDYSIVSMDSVGFDPDEIRFFNKEFGMFPKTCIGFDNSSQEESAKLAITVIKTMQKTFPALIFDPYSVVGAMIIGKDIQKIVFAPL